MKPHLLIVEDEDALTVLLEYHLEKEGYRTSRAADGEDALLKIEEDEPGPPDSGYVEGGGGGSRAGGGKHSVLDEKKMTRKGH